MAYRNGCARAARNGGLRWVALVTASSVAIVGPALSGSASAPPTTPVAGEAVAGAEDNAHLFVLGEVTVPAGEPGEVSVVLSGASDGTAVPVIVRNNTDVTVFDVDVSGVARDASGGLLATGTSQGIQPAQLDPGQWGMGAVYFDYGVLAGDESFEFVANGDTDSEFFSKILLTVSEAVLQGDDPTSVRVVGIVTNGGDVPVMGPNEVFVACFDGPTLVTVQTGYTDIDEIAPAGTAPFTVDLYEVAACPAVAIASSGWDF